MSVWTRVSVPGALGRFRVFEDGVERGDIVLEHPFATTLSAQMVAALNDEESVSSADRFVAVGWSSRAEHDADSSAIRWVLKSEPAEVRARVAEAWERCREGCDPSVPLSRQEMGEWIETVDLIISAFHAQTVVPDVAA